MPNDVSIPECVFSYVVRKNNFGDPIKTGTLDFANGATSIKVTLDETALAFVQIASQAGSGRKITRGGADTPIKLRPPGRSPHGG